MKEKCVCHFPEIVVYFMKFDHYFLSAKVEIFKLKYQEVGISRKNQDFLYFQRGKKKKIEREQV